MKTVQGGVAVIRRWYEDLFNEQRLGVADEIVTDDFVFYGPGAPDGIQGAAELKALVTRQRSRFPDGRFTHENELVAGSKIASRFTLEGSVATITGVDIFILRGGRIRELQRFVDCGI